MLSELSLPNEGRSVSLTGLLRGCGFDRLTHIRCLGHTASAIQTLAVITHSACRDNNNHPLLCAFGVTSPLQVIYMGFLTESTQPLFEVDYHYHPHFIDDETEARRG